MKKKTKKNKTKDNIVDNKHIRSPQVHTHKHTDARKFRLIENIVKSSWNLRRP